MLANSDEFHNDSESKVLRFAFDSVQDQRVYIATLKQQMESTSKLKNKKKEYPFMEKGKFEKPVIVFTKFNEFFFTDPESKEGE